ncbi:phospho-sugar mutase [Fusibacter sp. 3D3]|uniref:phospho-sugar mutase n=1 Tax=Fusibacter sp. 3D3 TaxID=1048380 RepID=UPI0008535FB0|nr:phospho-sugar mutase [Fusibacter sp. 3D3]GAU75684.1 phosphomannomutase [Fusibacter sp. 3D3]
MTVREKYEQWLENTYFDADFRAELKAIENRPNEIDDRFYRDLEFGTAGMRGVIGAGTNRINEYVVRKATQGFANFLLERDAAILKGKFEKSIVIAYDSRRKSYEFALESALVMAGNGIKAYLFDEVRTTPELSFAVRELCCIGGIMITASHNPPEYNGYKVYDETGCQLVPDLADALIEHVNQVADFEQVKRTDKKRALAEGLFKMIGEDVDLPYIEMVKKVSVRPELLKNSTLKVVYTPLHGTGGATIKRVLKEMAFSNLIEASSQMQPDGEFPTCKKPNPEEYEAFEVAIEYAEKHGADLVIATDPDCDRIGLLVKDKNVYRVLNGNQIGALFMEYLLSSRGDLTPEHYVVNTIVSSDLAKRQADHYGVKLIQTLTGFKFIGEQIEKDEPHFVMGYEESYGYLFDPHVRDKDAVMGTLIAIEMAEYFKQKGCSLLEQLDSIYKKHGFFIEETISKKFEGKEGHSVMMSIMARFRAHAADHFEFERIIDFLNDDTGLPKSDVLKYYLDEDSWFVLRPSGTEPKLKIYFSIQAETPEEAKQKLEYYKSFIVAEVVS